MRCWSSACSLHSSMLCFPICTRVTVTVALLEKQETIVRNKSRIKHTDWMEKNVPGCYNKYYFLMCMNVLYTCTCLHVFPQEAHMWDVCISLHMQVEPTIDARSLPQSFFTLFEDRTFHWTQYFFWRGLLLTQNLVLMYVWQVFCPLSHFPSTLTLLSIKQYQLALLQTTEERVSFNILPGPPNKTQNLVLMVIPLA